MTNKYLEKIARELGEEEVNHHVNRSWWKGVGGTITGGLVPVPFSGNVGSAVGRAHELAKVKGKITGHVHPMSDVAGEAARAELRATGRGMVHGVLGGGLGATLGAGAVHVLSKGRGEPAVGAMVGGGVGTVLGAIHGGRVSAHNSMRDFIKEWQDEKKK